MDYYFDDYAVTLQIIELQKLLTYDDDRRLLPLSPKATKLSNTIMIEINKVVNGVVNTDKLGRFEGYDEVRLVAQLACFKSIKNFIPYRKKKPGAFSFFSEVTRKSIKWYNTAELKKRQRLPTIDWDTLIDEPVVDNHDMHILVEDIWSKYNHLFITYKKQIFRLFCDYWILDPTHCDKRRTIDYAFKNLGDIRTFYGKDINRHLMIHYYVQIIGKIREHEQRRDS